MMNSKANKELKMYYKSIRKELLCDIKKKEQLLSTIKSSVACYIDENPNADMLEIEQHFGTAQEIAEEYCSTEDASTIKKKVEKSRIIVFSLIATLLIALVIYGIAVATMVIADIEASNGFGTETIEVISTSDVEV